MTKEYTGGSVSYYRVKVGKPTNPELPPYEAECNDIIESLGMNYAEGNAFKAIWRRCAARTLGMTKEGYKDGLYDAQKVEFFGARMVAQAQPQPIVNNPSRVELYSADAEARMDVIGQNGPTGEHYLSAKEKRWMHAPEWATHSMGTDGSGIKYAKKRNDQYISENDRPFNMERWHVVEARP